MGIEVFGLSMSFSTPRAARQIENLLTTVPNTYKRSVTGPTKGTTLFEFDDGHHFIEFQLREMDTAECVLAIRFSLCSYESIDPIFIEIVSRLLASHGASVSLMTSNLNQTNSYLPGDSSWLIAALPDEIKAMRIYWQKHFGNKQGAVRADDSFQFIGVANKR